MSQCGLLVAFTGLRGFFYRGVVHHPAPWASICGLLFLECAWSDTFNFCFHWLLIRFTKYTRWGTGASVYLGISVTIAWRVLGVTCPPFHHLHLLWVFLLRLRSVFYGSSWAQLFGVSLVFFGALTERITGSPLYNLSTLYFFEATIFARRAQCPHGPLDPGLIVWDSLVS